MGTRDVPSAIWSCRFLRSQRMQKQGLDMQTFVAGARVSPGVVSGGLLQKKNSLGPRIIVVVLNVER